jgi:hypothetical protein
MATKEPNHQPSSVCKLSIRVHPERRQDIKAVASLSGKNVQDWLQGLVESELKRMEPALQALRSASTR